MKYILTIVLSALFSVPTILFAQHTPNQIIVQLHYRKSIEQTVQELAETIPEANIRVFQVLSKSLNIWTISYDESYLDCNKALHLIRQNHNVALVQLNHTNIQSRAIPNDSLYNGQWCHFNANDFDMDSDEAWDITTGGVTALGDTIVVAVVDGGADLSHQDIDYWQNWQEIPNNGIDDDNNGYIDDVYGWHAYESGGTVFEDEDVTYAGPWDDHGIHVSGIIGAKGNNTVGVSGVNWSTKIMAIRGSSTNEAVLIKSYGYVYDQRLIYNRSNGDSGAYVVSTNSSFGVNNGLPANYPIWCGLYDSLGSVGILSAVAGPNLGIDIDTQGDIPGTCPSKYTLSVTNSTNTDVRNGSAGYGLINCDIAAPGTNILSTVESNQYTTKTGTSMATPQVAGAIALMYAAACEEMLRNYNPPGLAVAMRDYMLTAGFDSISSMAGESVTGGRLNLHKSVMAVTSYSCVLNVIGDINGNGVIDFPTEISGDINGNGVIDSGEIAGDVNGDGVIDFPEIAGDTNGNGIIDGSEIAGDNNGNGILDGTETSILQVNERYKLTIFPNPAQNSFVVSVENTDKWNVKLIDVLGEVLIDQNSFRTQQLIETQHLPNGVYFIIIEIADNVVTRKIVVNH